MKKKKKKKGTYTAYIQLESTYTFIFQNSEMLSVCLMDITVEDISQ